MKKANAEVLAQVRQMVEEHATEAGYVLNPIQSIREATLLGLARNLELYGRPFCPCRVVSDDVLKDPNEADKAVCPCSGHAMEIAEHGRCHCGLFMTKTAAEQYLKARAALKK